MDLISGKSDMAVVCKAPNFDYFHKKTVEIWRVLIERGLDRLIMKIDGNILAFA